MTDHNLPQTPLTGPELRYRGIVPPGVPVRGDRNTGRPSCPPTGYRISRTPEGRSVVPDPELAPLVAEAFRFAAWGGMTVRDLLAAMTARGLVSRGGSTMSVSSFWYLLTNPAYDGRTGFPPLVSRGLFEATQEALRLRRRN